MLDQIKETIVIVTKRLGTKELKDSDFINILSMERHWLSPDNVKKLLNICIEMHLLEKKGEFYVPTFGMKSIQVSLETKLTDEDLDKFTVPKPQKDLFLEVVEYLEKNTGMKKSEIVSNINKRRSKFMMIEVVALIYAKELDLDISPFLDLVAQKIFESVKED